VIGITADAWEIVGQEGGYRTFSQEKIPIVIIPSFMVKGNTLEV
jgi:hypothetical protein